MTDITLESIMKMDHRRNRERIDPIMTPGMMNLRGDLFILKYYPYQARLIPGTLESTLLIQRRYRLNKAIREQRLRLELSKYLCSDLIGVVLGY